MNNLSKKNIWLVSICLIALLIMQPGCVLQETTFYFTIPIKRKAAGKLARQKNS